MSKFHLSTSTVKYVDDAGTIRFPSIQSLAIGDNPVKRVRKINTSGDGGYIEYKTGLTEQRVSTLTVMNVDYTDFQALVKAYNEGKQFSITLVDNSNGTGFTMSDCVFETEPVQSSIGEDDSFDVPLSIIYNKLEYF